MERWKDSLSFGLLLNLLMPGSGHFFWRDYVFGLFIFLILLMAAVLFFVSYLTFVPTAAKAVLFVLPAVFYLFTFVDLTRSMKNKKQRTRRSPLVAILFLVVVTVFQLAAPVTPVNFVLRNMPELYRAGDNHLAPMLKSGDFAWTNPLAYKADVFFLDIPLWNQMPQRGDLVRFTGQDGSGRTGLVIGLSDEEVEIADGRLLVSGYPRPFDLPEGLRLHGDMPLTLVASSSILVANLNLGAIDQTAQVPLENLTGRVSRLF